MRTVDVKWQNLAAGLSRVEELEAKLRDQWAPRIKEVRRQRLEPARAAWEARQEPVRRQFEKDLAVWRATQEEKARELERQREAWELALSEERQRLGDLARRGGLAGLAIFVFVAAVFTLFGAPLSLSLTAAILGFVLALRPALIGWRSVRDLRSRDPALAHSEDPAPQFIPSEPEPQAPPRKPVAMDLSRQWWRAVVYDHSAAAARSKPAHGDEGEKYFARYLMARVPDKYVALRNVLVAGSLDVDLLLLGPTGMWIFEVKHLSGEIICRRGKWFRRRKKPGGYKAGQDEPIDGPPDAQWLREKHAVTRTLGRRLSDPGRIIPTIAGGIVFTHPKVAWDVDDSCKAGYGNAKRWARTVLNAPVVLTLTPEEQLRIVDALLNRAHRLDEDLGRATSCSVELAEGLFSNATAKARAYVRDSS